MNRPGSEENVSMLDFVRFCSTMIKAVNLEGLGRRAVNPINRVRLGWTFVHHFRSLQREIVNA